MGTTISTRSIAAHLIEVAELIGDIAASQTSQIAAIADLLVEASQAGRTVFIVGNGGSAATAEHFATDLSKNAAVGQRRLRAMSLVSNVALMTALANDLSYESVFEEQIELHAERGDVLIAISGSGNSPNILAAAAKARAKAMHVVGLCGFAGGQLRGLCDSAIVVDASTIQSIEDVHLALTHALTLAVRTRFRELEQGGVRRTAAVFVDRDGVVNLRRSDHVRNWGEFEFLPGAIEALARLSASGRRLFIVTNQAVIGRDGLEPRIVQDIHERAVAKLAAEGAHIEAVLICPHDPISSCGCRKPRPGLLLDAADKYGIDLENSVFVGDSLSDMRTATAAGCRGVLVGPLASSARGSVAAASLLDAVERGLVD